jgi:hypothetical protein
MHQAERRAVLVTEVLYGVDRRRLYVRVDASRPLKELLEAGYEFSLTFLDPDGVRYSVRAVDGRPAGAYCDRLGEPPVWARRPGGHAEVAAGTILEIALPFGELTPRGRLSFFLVLQDAAGVEVERHPAHRSVDVDVADARFEASNWTA